MANPGNSDRLLSVRDVADYLGTAPDTVYGWIASGQLSAVKLGTGPRPRIRVAPSDLQQFVAVAA